MQCRYHAKRYLFSQTKTFNQISPECINYLVDQEMNVCRPPLAQGDYQGLDGYQRSAEHFPVAVVVVVELPPRSHPVLFFAAA